jgi:hypothetical protein
MNPVPWGQGELCLNPLYFVRGPSSVADNIGRTLDTLDLQGLPAGSVYFQTLYRDFGGRTFNLSNLAEMGVSALGGPWGGSVALYFSPFSCESDFLLGEACVSAQQYDCYYTENSTATPYTVAEYTSGQHFNFFTQGGTVALEYRHWNDRSVSVTTHGSCSGYDSCEEYPAEDVVSIAIDFKVGPYWTTHFVEFDDGGTYEQPLIRDVGPLSGSSWLPARFQSVTGASKVRVRLVAYTGHDSLGVGLPASCTDENAYVEVDVTQIVHNLQLRQP